MSMTMSDKIKIVLIKKKMTVGDLAKKLECSTSNISNKFKRDNFSEKELMQLAEAMNCDFNAEFIIRETGERV